MDVKKNFMQAFKELTGNEEEKDEIKDNKLATENKSADDKPAFLSSFDSMKAKYAENTAAQTVPTTATAPAAKPNQTASQTGMGLNAKPAFSQGINNAAPKSGFNSAAPAFSATANTVQHPAPAASAGDFKLDAKQEDKLPTGTDDFLNTFLKARGADDTVAEAKAKQISSAIENKTEKKPDIPFNEEKADAKPQPEVLNPAETTIIPKTEEKPIAPATLKAEEKIVTPSAPKIEEKPAAPAVKEEVKTEVPADNMAVSPQTTVITENTEIEGSITSSNNILIQGKVKGDVTNENELCIMGTVEGDIMSDNIKIDGTVTGNITSANSLHIMKNAVITGDIVTSTIRIDEGAVFQGKISMNIK